MTEKDAKVQAKKDRLGNDAETARKEQLAAEVKVNKERAEAIAKKNAELAAAAKAAEAAEEPTVEAEAETEAPAEESTEA